MSINSQKRNRSVLNVTGGIICICFISTWFTVAQTAIVESQNARVNEVFVKPVLLIANDTADPPSIKVKLLMSHVAWCQSRYHELLFGMDTFSIATNSPLILRSRHAAATFKAAKDGGAELALIELMEHDKVNRFNCPFIYLVCFTGTGNWPAGGGRPINGGVNTGGGIVILAAESLTNSPNFQSTLQHELGHSFGLPHVDVYGYSMKNNASIMSYNPNHHTDGFMASKTPGRFILEDYRVLNMNHRVFPHFHLPESMFHPNGYKLSPRPIFLGPMKITGQPDYNGPQIGF